ncbi:MAG: hypothetical protein GY828_07550 [Candidatus Gracilibacteria bacterium]|nr:hypothetical protein [Candidatus Gracilibacteria bacterium]
MNKVKSLLTGALLLSSSAVEAENKKAEVLDCVPDAVAKIICEEKKDELTPEERTEKLKKINENVAIIVTEHFKKIWKIRTDKSSSK